MSKNVPNSFQTPNAIVDTLMPLLKPNELILLLYATRHILGWQDKIEDRKATISLSNFEKGAEDHPYMNGCGLSANAIKPALKSLKDYGILEAVEVNESGTRYRLAFMDSEYDIEGLENRKRLEDKKNKKRTQKAQEARARKRQNEQGSMSDIPSMSDNPPPSMSDIPTPQYVGHTTTKHSIQTQNKNPYSATKVADANPPEKQPENTSQNVSAKRTENVSSVQGNSPTPLTFQEKEKATPDEALAKSEKRQRKPDPVFDAIAVGSFEGVKVGGRIGKIKREMLAHYPNATEKTVTAFYEWWRENYDIAPPRDASKWIEHFAAFKKAVESGWKPATVKNKIKQFSHYIDGMLITLEDIPDNATEKELIERCQLIRQQQS